MRGSQSARVLLRYSTPKLIALFTGLYFSYKTKRPCALNFFSNRPIIDVILTRKKGFNIRKMFQSHRWRRGRPHLLSCRHTVSQKIKQAASLTLWLQHVFQRPKSEKCPNFQTHSSHNVATVELSSAPKLQILQFLRYHMQFIIRCASMIFLQLLWFMGYGHENLVTDLFLGAKNHAAIRKTLSPSVFKMQLWYVK